MKVFYWEELNMTGAWCPVAGPTRPTLKGNRIDRIGSLGSQVRCVQEILPEFQELTLSELQKIYGGEP